MSSPSRGLKDVIEHKLETPVFFIVAAMMVIRAAQIFSGGALVMARWLGPVWFPRFEIATGLGLGLGSEMLMTLAGRSWRSWLQQATDIASRPGLSKIQRTSYISEAKRNARYSFWFMIVGGISSLYTGVGFLLTNSTTNGQLDKGQAFQDVITCAVITAVVLYIGVFRETSGQDETQAELAKLDASMNAVLATAIEHFKNGTSTDQENLYICEHLPQHRQAKFRRSIAKANKGRMWKASQIREALGIGQDARLIRDLNRQINLLARTPENALTKAEDGRTWLIPHAIVMDTWGEAMAEYAAMRRIGALPVPQVTQLADEPLLAIGQADTAPSELPGTVPTLHRTTTDSIVG